MREIKFRAWDSNNKRWLQDNDSSAYSVDFDGVVSRFGYAFETFDTIYDIELMQYTGLHSKNEIELYDGDIIILAYVVKEHAKCVICYDSKQARYKAVPIATYKSNSGSGGWTGFELFTNCEIIGNIYENPDLLEG